MTNDMGKSVENPEHCGRISAKEWTTLRAGRVREWDVADFLRRARLDSTAAGRGEDAEFQR